MFEDDDLPHFRKEKLTPRKLEGLSREDLQEYLQHLASEKARAEQALEEKGGIQNAAEALFRN